MVDVQPHYFGGLIDRVDLVIDHHPEQPGYAAVFKDIRADYGSTSTILTEHLRAVDVNISERTVKFHVSNLLNKFGVRRRADLILLCFQQRQTVTV
jgi:nanoRNase/pAp phosphatase (c-di-AMP/oligoRNAs hydrolase)